MNTISGVAITLGKALLPEFKTYARQVLVNSKALAAALLDAGLSLITGGTDNHMMVVDVVKSFDMDGTEAEVTLDRVGITTNKQIIPDDPNPPLRPSGIRIGTPAVTARGMGEKEVVQLAGWMVDALRHSQDETHLAKIKKEVEAFCLQFPVPGIE